MAEEVISKRRTREADPAPPARDEPAVPERGLPRTTSPIGFESHGLSKTHRQRRRPEFDSIVLLLQGGGALGAYQAGVYEALAESDLHPDWVAGISIGSINAAILAGNPRNLRVQRLREYWEGVTTPAVSLLRSVLPQGDVTRGFVNQVSAAIALFGGAAGFFQPRFPSPWFYLPGAIEATSYYDTMPLKATLERLIDFDRMNSDHTDLRLSLGAVNVRSGNLIYFDSQSQRITPEHVMASGALPPAFPAIEIEGEHYWDGGLVSNTPLQWIVAQRPADSLVFQVDLWSAAGEMPRGLAEVATRQKEIQYSSRTRAFTKSLKDRVKLQNAIVALLEELPEDMKQSEHVKYLSAVARRHVYNLVQLIYRPKGHEGESKDYEFSRRSMEDHWRAGYHDAVHALRHPEIFERPTGRDALVTFDLRRDGVD